LALRSQPYIPLYVQDFMTDEKLSECSAESTGVYIRVMCIMHKSQEYGTVLLKQKDKQNPSKIKNFAVKLHRLMPYSVDVIERSLIELVDEEVLTIEGDVLMQRRMVRDGNISLIRANAGKKGGMKANTQANTQAKQQAKDQANTQANTEYEYEYEIEDVNSTTNKDIYPILFDAFWQAYPKKVGKADALKAFTKLKPDNELMQTILAAIAQWSKTDQWSKDNRQYVPMPATYIRGRRWEDELPQQDKPKERAIKVLN